MGKAWARQDFRSDIRNEWTGGKGDKALEASCISGGSSPCPCCYTVVFVQSGHWLITSRNASAKQGTRLRWILHRYHLVFLSSVSFPTTTGAAGMLNHHSLNLLVHRSVLALRGGELLVHTSRNISSISTLVGTMARLKAIITNATIALSVAYDTRSRQWNIYKTIVSVNLSELLHTGYNIWQKTCNKNK